MNDAVRGLAPSAMMSLMCTTTSAIKYIEVQVDGKGREIMKIRRERGGRVVKELNE